MSDGTIAAYLAQHPKLTATVLTILLLLSQSGVVAAGEKTIAGP